MPIYEYECPECGAFEHIQSISSKPLRRCPSCGRGVHKLVSPASFRLKGGGWFADGYSSRKPSAAKSGASGSNGSNSSDSKTADKAKNTEKSTENASKN